MADSSSFDYWSADGELALYPAAGVDAGLFDYWREDGELASYPPAAAAATAAGQVIARIPINTKIGGKLTR